MSWRPADGGPPTGAQAPAVLVTIVSVEGSAPRDAGTRMAVTAAETFGTIGGGQLEYRATAIAREMLCTGDAVPDEHGAKRDSAPRMDGHAEVQTLRIALGPSLGQCCGGAVTLRLERIARPGDAESLEALVAPHDPHDTRVYVFGAGHVGRALVRVLAMLPCRVVWIDGRSGQVPPDVARAVDLRITDDAEGEVEAAPPKAYFVVMTHSHALDLSIVEAVLRRGDYAYVGVIGSATKRAKFARRLQRRGLPPRAISRLCCPIGLPGIEGKSPAEIAVAVAAELLVAREAAAAGRCLACAGGGDRGCTA